MVLMNKVIYLGTTYKCSACKLQEYLLRELLEERSDIELKVCDYNELPQWLQTDVSLTDFPVTILVKDEVIKYHFVGTMTKRKMQNLLEDINF